MGHVAHVNSDGLLAVLPVIDWSDLSEELLTTRGLCWVHHTLKVTLLLIEELALHEELLALLESTASVEEQLHDLQVGASCSMVALDELLRLREVLIGPDLHVQAEVP